MNGCVKRLKRAIWIVCVVIATTATVEGADVTLEWSPNPEPDVEGYTLSYGTASGEYTFSIDVGNTTTHTVTNLFTGQPYYFALQAYNAAGLSPYSNEVSATLTSPLTVVNLTANRTSPQPVNTTITFSATASGGTPPYQYKWWIVTGATQTVGSNWSASNSFAWTPTAANPNYTIRVWARNNSSTADAPDNPAAILEMSFAITSSATNTAPTVNAGADRTITLPSSTTLTATVSDDGQPIPPGALTLSWTRVSGPGTVTFSAPTAATTTASFSAAGAYVLRLTASDGALSTSDDVAVTVAAAGNTAPTGTITQPVAGMLYNAGQTISVAGTGTDPQDGTLPASAFTWEVIFHHDTHTHPMVAPVSGIRSGSFTIPATGETSTNVWYRIHLTVRDSNGNAHSSYRDIMPRTVQLTLNSNPAGLQLRLDGQPVTAPHVVNSVVGMVRSVSAVSPQTLGATTYQFASWSDGGAATHNITTPSAATTYAATFSASGPPPTPGLRAVYYDNTNFTGASVTRIDPTVDFVWTGAPATGISADTFSAVWTGTVQAAFSETYTFYTQSNEGVRLYVNGQLLVNNWTSHAMQTNSGTIALTANQWYSIRMEFWDGTGSATARLGWGSASTPVSVIPASRLAP